MPQLTLRIVNQVKPTQVLAAEELIEQQLGGLPVQAALRPAQLDGFIQASQRLVEQQLGLLLARQAVTEDSDLLLSEYQALGYIRTSYPVERATALEGGLNDTQKQIAYPADWLQSRRSSDPTGYARQVYIVPNGSSGSAVVTTSYALTFASFALPYAAGPGQLLRNYWRVSYITGFASTPPEILNIIGRLSAVLVMYQLANVVLAPGIANQSLSIDGLSQSLSASNPYSGTIKGYLDGAKQDLEQLRGTYQGIRFIVC